MAWRLRTGVSLHPMPFGGAFVVDDARLAARQISSELTHLLAGTAPVPAGPPPPVLAAELRLGLDDGWLIHQVGRQAERPGDQRGGGEHDGGGDDEGGHGEENA